MARAQAAAPLIPPESGLAGLARAMVQYGQLEESEAVALAREAHREGVTFVERLVASGRIRSAEVAQFASSTFGYPLLDLSSYDRNYLPRGTIDSRLIQSARVVPLYVRGKHLALAISDPTRTDVIHDVKFHSGLAIDPIVVEDDKLSALVEAAVRTSQQALDAYIDETFDFEFAEDESAQEVVAGSAEIDDAPVVKFIQKMMVDAIAQGASDIHFEPYEKNYQVNVNDKAGLSFASALRSFLRQDPDVIMVGEIRDLETAEIAVKAAQTGHLVLASLHTNDAPASLTRLMNMGITPFNMASSVNLITAQRLARRLCSCKRPDLLAARSRAEGVLDLRQAGLLKVRHGLTSLQEVMACTNE